MHGACAVRAGWAQTLARGAPAASAADAASLRDSRQRLVPEAEHFAVAGARLVLESQQMEGAVSRQERDFRREWPAPPLRLPSRLCAADHDVAELQRAV